MRMGLIALAAGSLGLGLTEFVIGGPLPEVATDFSVSGPVAGFLISGYALTAAITRLDRKPVRMGGAHGDLSPRADSS